LFILCHCFSLSYLMSAVIHIAERADVIRMLPLKTHESARSSNPTTRDRPRDCWHKPQTETLHHQEQQAAARSIQNQNPWSQDMTVLRSTSRRHSPKRTFSMWHADLARDPTGKSPCRRIQLLVVVYFEKFSVLRVSVVGLIMGRWSPQSHREQGEK